MPITDFPTQIVEINYSRDVTGDEHWMIATAEADGQRWEVSARLPADDTEVATTRRKLGLAIITGIQQMTARPCGTKGCDRRAFNHGDVRLEGPGKDLDIRHVHVCEPCKNAITATAPAGPMSVLLMPYFAFTEYDV